MSLTLNKIARIIVAGILCLCIALSLSACGEAPRNLDDADQICVSGALYESGMYTLTDEAFIDEIVTIFDSVDTEKTHEAVDMMTAQEVLCFTFSNGNETLGKIIVDSNNHLCYKAGGQSYKITSEFDFGYVKELVDTEIEDVKTSLNATPDEL